ncbi:MAG: rhodanese-like domain-containing protein [Pseudomonadota bacterium]
MTLRWYLFYLGLIGALLAALLLQGAKVQQTALRLERQVKTETLIAALRLERHMAAYALYEDIRKSPGKYQIVDLREAAEFEDGHLPQAVRLKPGPVPKDAPLDRYKRTVIVSEDGDPALYQARAREFKLATNLNGGMMQWRMSRLPEVSGLTDVEGLRRGRPG